MKTQSPAMNGRGKGGSEKRGVEKLDWGEGRDERGRERDSAAGGCDLPPRIRLKIKRYALALVSAECRPVRNHRRVFPRWHRVEEVLATGPVGQTSTSDEDEGEKIERRRVTAREKRHNGQFREWLSRSLRRPGVITSRGKYREIW